MKKLIILLTLLTLVTAQAQQAKKQLVPVKRIPYTQKLFQHDNVYIGPQPSYVDFATIKNAGITKVINMRTPEEMKELRFYEDYLLEKAGIQYSLIPIGGKDHKYSPAKLEEFAKQMDSADGKVLLHCRSGHRASQLWAAYLVKYKGKTPDEALAMVADMGWWPMPMEALLDKKLHVSIEE
ncbi:MAG TPA: hypothetical protein ENJ44_06340 [Oceanospirillales bacterium]|nr:hypothetical protein [Oceanospirillales bacterium]